MNPENWLIVMSDERNPAVSFAVHVRLIPAFYIEFVAQTRTVSAGLSRFVNWLSAFAHRWSRRAGHSRH